MSSSRTASPPVPPLMDHEMGVSQGDRRCLGKIADSDARNGRGSVGRATDDVGLGGELLAGEPNGDKNDALVGEEGDGGEGGGLLSSMLEKEMR